AMALIHGSKQSDDDAMRRFFTDVWIASANTPTTYQDVTVPGGSVSDEMTITAEHARGFCENTGKTSWQYVCAEDGKLVAPLEFAELSAMRSLLGMFQATLFGSGQANIVHYFNRFEIADGVRPILVGDTISVTVSFDGLENAAASKKLSLTTVMERDGQPIGTTKSVMISRLHRIDVCEAFAFDREHKITIVLPSAADVAVLESRE
ncbi:fatty acid synthase alpha subunit Lsd1, partial [Coemansia spiralis]